MPPLSTTAIATISGAIAFISIGAIGVFAIWRLRKRRALQQDTVLPLHHQRSLTRSLPHGHSHSYSQSNSQGHNHHHHSPSHSYSNSQSQTQNHLAGQQHENPHQNDRPSTGSIKENQQQQPGTWEGLGFARLTAALSRSTGSVGSPKSQNSHQRAQPEVSPKSAWSPMSDTSPRPQRSSPWSPWSPKSVRSARSGWSIRSNWPLGSARSPRSVKSVRGWPLRSPDSLGSQGRRERQQGERSRQLGNLNQQTTSQGQQQQQQQQLPGGNRQEGQRETTTQRGRERNRGAPKASARRKDESRPPTPPPKDRPTTTSLGTSPPRSSPPPQGSTHTRLSFHLVAGPRKDYSLPKQTSASTGSPHTHIPSNSYLNPAGEPWVRVPPPAAALPPRPLRPPSRTATVPAPTLSLFPRNSSAATGGAVVPVMMGGRTGIDTRTITGMGTGIVPTTNPQHRRVRSASQPRRARSQSVLVVKVPPLTSPKSTSHLYHAMISGGSRIGAAR